MSGLSYPYCSEELKVWSKTQNFMSTTQLSLLDPRICRQATQDTKEPSLSPNLVCLGRMIKNKNSSDGTHCQWLHLSKGRPLPALKCLQVLATGPSSHLVAPEAPGSNNEATDRTYSKQRSGVLKKRTNNQGRKLSKAASLSHVLVCPSCQEPPW